MKTNIFFPAFLMLTVYSCTSPRYLPLADNLGENLHGSYIALTTRNHITVKGELIAADSSAIVILNKTDHKCIKVATGQVKWYVVQYAKPNYSWTVLAFTATSLTHGFWGVFTGLVNLGVTSAISSHAFKYTPKNQPLHNLKLFARFPEGIPANIPLASIK